MGLLVLARFPSQKLILTNRVTGDRIEVMVVRAGNQPRIGIAASGDWQIDREEVLTGMQPRPAEVTR